MATDVTDLSCMTADNVAAIALQMQKTALEAEARIFQLEKLLRFAVNAPTIIQTSTATITGLTANLVGEQSVGPAGGGSFTTNFNNTNVAANIDESGRTLIAQIGEGEYEIGIFCSTLPSGTVNDNTFRYLVIAVDRLDPTVVSTVTPSERRVVESRKINFETNTTDTVDMCVTLRFRLTKLDRIKFLYEHGNTGSTLTAQIGTIVWLTKIGSNDSVTVV